MQTLLDINTHILIMNLMVLFSPFFWLLVVIIAYQYVKMTRMKEYLFGIKDHSALRLTVVSLGLGVFGGWVGSVITVLFGITVPESGFLGLLMVAVLLMMLHPRFLCFAYAGGILSLTSLVFGFPSISVPHLMALVAVLHLIEGMLIRLSGHLDALPVYTRNKSLQPVGGFNLQKFWPLPLVILSVNLGSDASQGISMPEWWPLLHPQVPGSSRDLMFTLMPAVVGLGYGELALTSTASRRSRVSARNLMLYSLGLLGLSVAASHAAPLQWLAALYAPIGHEVVIALAHRKEMGESPLYVPTSRGMKLLDVVRPSPAARAGLRSGDVVLDVEGVPVNTPLQVQDALAYSNGPVSIRYWRRRKEDEPDSGEIRTARAYRSGRESLGMIPVPGYGGEQYLDFKTPGYWDWVKKWTKRKTAV